MKKMGVSFHADANALKGKSVKLARILVLNIRKRLPDEIQKMDHFATPYYYFAYNSRNGYIFQR